MTTKPFTYHICWSKENLHYYGVRYAKGCCPEELWTKYHTSSPKVKDLRESIGEPDIIEVRKTFHTKEQACNWENRVLYKLNIIKNQNWINECAFPLYDWVGKKHTKESKKKMSDAAKGRIPWNKGKKATSQIIKNMAAAQKGKKASIETKKKMSDAKKGKSRPKWIVEKITASNTGQIRSVEAKQRMSEAQKEYWRKKNG